LESILHVESSAWVPFELFKNIGKTPKSSVPVLSAGKTLVFRGFFAFLANSFGFPAYPCMSMPAGAAPCRNHRLVRWLGPW